MKFILDTQLILWAANDDKRLSPSVVELIEDPTNTPVFSAASLWEVAIKQGLRREDFLADVARLRRNLTESGYEELPVLSLHALALVDLPSIHKDPFDRILVAQARAEGLLLLTADRVLADYPGPIRLV